MGLYVCKEKDDYCRDAKWGDSDCSAIQGHLQDKLVSHNTCVDGVIL